MTQRPPRAVGQSIEPDLLVAVEKFVAGLSGYPEGPASIDGHTPLSEMQPTIFAAKIEQRVAVRFELRTHDAADEDEMITCLVE